MPEINPTENIGMTLLRLAAADEEALVENCCAFCHSADVERVPHSSDHQCRNCGQRMEDGELKYASPLAGALACHDHWMADAPLRRQYPQKIEPHEVVALIEHAARLHMQVRELSETLRVERERMRWAFALTPRREMARVLALGEFAGRAS